MKFFLALLTLTLALTPHTRAAVGGVVGGFSQGQAGNTWEVWASSTNSTVTNFNARNSKLGVSLAHTDFSTLMQTVVNRAGFNAYIHIAGNPILTATYNVNSTIIITNTCIIEGDGNPSTVLQGTDLLNGPIFQIGTASVSTFGINRFQGIRFSGGDSGANGTGLKFVNCPEPVVDRCEFTGFPFAGVQMASSTVNFWSFINETWFVVQGGSIGILFDVQPSDPNFAECMVNLCTFGIGQGSGIVSSNRWRSVAVRGNQFFWASPFSASVNGIRLWAGDNFQIQNNEFTIWPTAVSPIRFEARASATNYSGTIVSGNSTWSSAAAATNLVFVGANVQGVAVFGNNNITGGTTAVFNGNNGQLFQFDTGGLRLGDTNRVAITNILTLSTNLDFASQALGGLEDIPVYCGQCVSGDIVSVSPPQVAATGIIGTFSGYSSNSYAYVRFISNAASQNPAAGTYKIVVTKF